jgi:Protein of unknown function (DUF3352)
MRRPKLRRPNLPRPRRPDLTKPKLPGDLWFRFITRIRAILYWIREKAQIAVRALRRSGEAAVDWWARRSGATKQRTFAVIGVVALYAVLKFAPVPGVPCEVSAAKECAPPNDTIAYVPADALLYAHFTVKSDSHQSELAGDLAEQMPDVSQLAQQVTSAVPSPAGAPLNVTQEILPWAKDDMALTLVPGPKKTSLPVFIVGVGDREAAAQFVSGIAPAGVPKESKHDDSTINVYPQGFATAYAGDQLLFGLESAVRTALDAKAGKVPDLGDSDQDAPRDELPDVRLAEVYLSPAGVQRLLATGGAGSTQLETFVDYGATSGVAASLSLRDDGVQANLVSNLDEKLLQKSPTFFADLPQFHPELAGEAGSRALGYIGVGEIGPSLTNVLARAGAQSQGLAGSLRTLAQRLQKEAGVDPLKDLLPALGGQAALVAEPTDAAPYASLIVEGVDEEKATKALAGLQRPVLRSLGTTSGTAKPTFDEQKQDGVTVSSVDISPTVNVSYAIFDGKLVISTDPAGIEQVRAGGDDLAGTAAYERAVDELPDEVSALVFLNLDEVVGLATQAGLAEDPLYAALSDDISKIGSIGLSVKGGDDQLRSELFLALE